MRLEVRCVLDTNTVVSALCFEQSLPARAFGLALEQGEVLVSQATIAELREVLARKKFDRYLSRDERDQFLAGFLLRAVLVETVEEVRFCRDPKDDKFLELALAGNASCLMSGDKDLLALHPFRGVPILAPAAFLASLDADGAE